MDRFLSFAKPTFVAILTGIITAGIVLAGVATNAGRYQDKVDRMECTVAPRIEGKVDNLTLRFDAHERDQASESAALKENVKELTKAVDELNQTIKELNRRK